MILALPFFAAPRLCARFLHHSHSVTFPNSILAQRRKDAEEVLRLISNGMEADMEVAGAS